MNEQHVIEWKKWLCDVRHLRGATLTAYGSTLDLFQQFANDVDEDLTWSEVTPALIEQFMGRVRRGNRVGAPASQERDRVVIALFFKWAMNRGLVAEDPTFNVGVPRVSNRAPRAVADRTWAQLWSSNLCDDDRVWLGLMCFAGLRRREAVMLSPEQVDWRRGMFLGMERKGGKEEAVEYEQMTRVLADVFPQLVPDPDGWLELIAASAEMRRGERCLITLDMPTTPRQAAAHSFTVGERLPAPSVLNQRLETVLKAAGLKPNAFTPHALRHTCVTNLLRAGVPIEVVSDAVGHSAIDTTRRYVKSAGRLEDWRTRLKRG